jgi:hypothetical protein
MGSDLPRLLNPEPPTYYEPARVPSSSTRPVQPDATSHYISPWASSPNRSAKRRAAVLDEDHRISSTSTSTSPPAPLLAKLPPSQRASTPQWTAVNHPRSNSRYFRLTNCRKHLLTPCNSLPLPRTNGELSRTAASWTHQSDPQTVVSPTPSKRPRRLASPIVEFIKDSTATCPNIEHFPASIPAIHSIRLPLTPPGETPSPDLKAPTSPTPSQPSPLDLRTILSPYVQIAAASLTSSPEATSDVTTRPSSSGEPDSSSPGSPNKRRRSLRFIASTVNMEMMPPPRPIIGNNSHVVDAQTSRETPRAFSPAGSPAARPSVGDNASRAPVSVVRAPSTASSGMSDLNHQSMESRLETRSCNCRLAMIEKWGALNEHARNGDSSGESIDDYISRLEGHRAELNEIKQEVLDDPCSMCGRPQLKRQEVPAKAENDPVNSSTPPHDQTAPPAQMAR